MSETTLNQPQLETLAKRLKNAFSFFRKKKRELMKLSQPRKIEIRTSEHYLLLSQFQSCGVAVPVYIEKETDVECLIFDIKQCLEKHYPDLYCVFTDIEHSGDVLSKFYSGKKKSYIKIYLLDLLENPNFQELTSSEQMIFMDIMRYMNYLSLRDPYFFKNGFTYTYKHCKFHVSEETFKKAIPNLVRLGFLSKLDRKIGRMNLYIPSKEWAFFSSEG